MVRVMREGGPLPTSRCPCLHVDLCLRYGGLEGREWRSVPVPRMEIDVLETTDPCLSKEESRLVAVWQKLPPCADTSAERVALLRKTFGVREVLPSATIEVGNLIRFCEGVAGLCYSAV